MKSRKDPTPKQKDAVLREAGYRCANPLCGTIIVLDVHHIVEVHIGGGNEVGNLLALCPTCHALYHRKSISIESIQYWKARLIAINKAGIGAEGLFSTSTERKGFALGFVEFSWRTCQIGLRDGSNFKEGGLCTFVAPSIAISTARLIESIVSHSPRFGTPTISTKLGMAPFVVKSLDEHLGIIEMGEIDDSYVANLVKGEPIMAAMMAAPLQTLVRYRMLPFVGEEVGLIHSPKTTRNNRGTMEFQFDQSVVSYMNNAVTTKKHFQFTLSTMPTRIEEEGTPVFAIDGRLLGLVAEVTNCEEEFGWRAIITNLLGLRGILPEETTASSSNQRHSASQ